jgi:hyperosmotically inducible protein
MALAAALAGCQRVETQADAKRVVTDVASDLKEGTQKAAAKAGDHLADGWLSTKIQSKFVGDHDLKATDISVSSRDGVVTLKGRVENEPMRSLAVAIAKNTDGVKQVVDQLSVVVAGPVAPLTSQNPPAASAVATTGTVETTHPSAGYSDDGRITMSIQSKYFLDDKIKGRQVNVDTTNGVVTLTGQVGSESERGEALLLARTTEGVKRVEDSLSVMAEPSANAAPDTGATHPATAQEGNNDASMTTRIQSKFSSDTQVKNAAINVTARSGVVLLEGAVPSTAVKQRALGLARETDGVTQVIDRIRVGKRPN